MVARKKIEFMNSLTIVINGVACALYWDCHGHDGKTWQCTWHSWLCSVYLSDVVLSRWDWMWLTVFICIKKHYGDIWLFPSSKSISKTHFLGKFHPTFHISIYFPYFMVSFGWVSSGAWCRISCQSLRPAGCSWWRIASSTPEPRFLGTKDVAMAFGHQERWGWFKLDYGK